MKDCVRYLRYHLNFVNGLCHPLKKRVFESYRKHCKIALVKKTCDGISTIYYYCGNDEYFALVVVDLAKAYLF